MARTFLLIVTVAIAHAQGTLSGVVLDDTTGKPIADARVSAGRSSQLRTEAAATTNNAGRFEFKTLAPGQYWIGSAHDGYVQIEGYRLDDPRADVLSGAVTAITVRMIPAASMDGRLLTSDGEPIPGATVEVFRSGQPSAVTGADGHFRLVGLPPGEYKLRARLDDLFRHADATASPTTALPRIVFYPDAPDAASAAPIAIAKGTQLRDIEFRVKPVPVVTVAGVVIDSRTGAPLESGQMELRPEGSVASADATTRLPLRNGTFRFDLLPPAAYRAYIYRSAAPGSAPFITPIQAGAAGAEDIRITLPFGGRLSGIVRGPVAGLTAIQLMPAGSFAQASAKIDGDGRFIFEGLAPGKWTLGFQGGPSAGPITVKSIRQGSRNLFSFIEIVDGENPPIEVELARMLHVTGVVLDRSGKPVEQATVMFYSDEEPNVRRSIPSGMDGHFDIGIISGDFRVSAFRSFPPRQTIACDTTQPVHLTENLAGLKLVLCP